MLYMLASLFKKTSGSVCAQHIALHSYVSRSGFQCISTALCLHAGGVIASQTMFLPSDVWLCVRPA